MYFGIFQSIGIIVLLKLTCLIFGQWKPLPFDFWVFWQDPTSSWLLPLYLLSDLTRFFVFILHISCLSPRITLFLRNQAEWFSGKLNFRSKVWMVGMFIYLGLVIVPTHFNKINYVGRSETYRNICLNVYLSKDNVS